ncbi:TonB-dependent receptor [Pelagibacterales bacterium SAG-MED33]|nr:TonB-dependent receptor [Pelagibacterales bacterium SAG-MED33]
MCKKMLITSLVFFYILFVTKIHAEEIPIIVIAPSKKVQSISTVGTSVTVLDEAFFENTNEFFLGDVLSSNSTSSNFFQNGGHGTSSAVQLRGLPKRYSTVYIDGVKMSDPSSVSNDFEFNHILTSQISRVEILKGNQSSVYGSGAIGGTINIFTKDPKKGFHKNLSYNTGSFGTHNLSGSISGADKKNSYYLGLERFNTNGISQMMHNKEKDRYRNNSVIGKYNYFFTDKLKFQSNLRFADTYLQYDKEIDTATATHDEEVDGIESSYNMSMTYDFNEKFSNKFTLANTYIKRIYGATENSGNASQDNYYGDRYLLSYTGNYNFNLDNSIVFGIEREDDQIGYNKDLSGREDKHNYVTSNYFDLQTRLTNNIFFTFGSRFDEHSIAGNEDSHRSTFAYLFDDKTLKLKSSYGTGFRYPSLYEMFFVYASNSQSVGFVKAENSKSFDIGFEKFFSSVNLNLEANYFNLKYEDVLEGWKTGRSSGSAYTTQNMPGTVKSQGLELISKWVVNDFLNLGLNYTYTSTYDGAEQDDPNPNSNYYNAQMVRVPRNIINIKTNFKLPNYKNIDFTINTKWSDMARDYGNGNRTFRDERIDDYLVNDLNIKSKLWDSYDVFLNVTNLLDEKYETARDYSQLGRSFNFGIKKTY